MPSVGYRHTAETKTKLVAAWRVRRERDHDFWDRVTDTGFCWLFNYANSRHGYGELVRNGRRWRAHRYAYEALIGPIPDGMTLDHLCRVRLCVNPDHLEVVTVRENVLRSPTGTSAINARKTHCIRGHEFTPDNTARRGGGRACRTCERQYQRDRAARQRQCLADKEPRP